MTKQKALSGKLKAPENITLGTLNCVAMPNGELICGGKTIGWFKDLGQYFKSEEVSNDEQ